MSDQRFGGVLGAGALLALGLIIASAIGGFAFVKGKRADQSVTVTGSARKRIRSDLVIWRAGVSYQSTVLSDAYKSLSESVPRVKSYLMGKGIAENQITISAITSQTLHSKTTEGEDTGQITGYSLRQELESSIKRCGQDCKDCQRGDRTDQSGHFDRVAGAGISLHETR